MTESSLSHTPVVVTQRKGHLGRIILSRPRQLNAVDYEMACGISRVLDEWEADSSVRVISLEGAEPRAFCAGGDLKNIRNYIMRGETDDIFQQVLSIYALMRRIAGVEKPVVSFMDGIAMGGGIGLGAHASHRVVTERSVLAMPETGIGLTPDAGGSWILTHAPGFSGLRLAVTGNTMTPGQAIANGFADYMVESDTLSSLKLQLEERLPDEVFSSVPAGPAANVQVLDACYDAPDLLSAVKNLKAHNSEEAKKDLDMIARACPFSMRLSWEAWYRARTLPTFEAVFAQEECLVNHLLRRSDFSEGVRSRLIDRDNMPTWTPSVIDDVDEAEIKKCFMPL